MIFKKVVNDASTAKSDIVDYLAKHGGPGPAMCQTEAVVDCFNKSTIIVGSDGNYELSLKEYCAVAHFLATSQKIQAVKSFRMATGLGLKESKEAVENEKNWPMPME